MKYSTIIGTGSYLPEKVLTNQDLEKIVNTTSEWIIERTGIHERHVAADHETASSMGTIAAKKALEAAKIDPSEVDLIIVATTTPDKIFPSTACFIQERLDIAQCPAFDLAAACAGFNYALAIADQFIRSNMAKTALVVGSELMTRILDWTDRGTCILFGDGAGAVLLRQSSEPGIFSSHLHANGRYQDLLYAPNAFTYQIFGHEPLIRMNGSEVFKEAVKKLRDLVSETLKANSMEQSDIDWLVPHQANLRIIEAIAKRLNLSTEKVVLTIKEHGNTSAASIPLALDQAVRDGRIRKGHILLLESFGAGFTWGSTLLRF